MSTIDIISCKLGHHCTDDKGETYWSGIEGEPFIPIEPTPEFQQSDSFKHPEIVQQWRVKWNFRKDARAWQSYGPLLFCPYCAEELPQYICVPADLPYGTPTSSLGNLKFLFNAIWDAEKQAQRDYYNDGT